MADFTALKTAIQNAIKQNGNEEITGNLLQQILLSMVTTLGDSAINDLVTAINAEIANRGNADTELGNRITSEAEARAGSDNTLRGLIDGITDNIENGYVYAGIATPSSTPASGKVFYLALIAGTYTNFGATVVPQGINILKYNDSAWVLESFLGLDNTPTQDSNNLVKSGGIYNAILNAVGDERTRALQAEATLQQSISNERNRATNAENNLHEEVLEEKNERKQEIVGVRNDVLNLIHDYQPIVIEGNVVNAPDEEDITQEPNNLLKFKDKAYNPTIFSGLGKKYLRKNVLINEDYISFDGFVINPQAEDVLEGVPDAVLWDRLRERFVAQKDEQYYLDWQGSSIYLPVDEDKIYVNENIPYFWNGEDLAVDDNVIERYGNKLTQDMLSEENTVYIIQYDYTLASNITIPENCILLFDGGSISGGFSIDLNNAKIEGSGLKCDFTSPFNNTIAISQCCIGSETPVYNKTALQRLVNNGISIIADVDAEFDDEILISSIIKIKGNINTPTLSFPNGRGFVWSGTTNLFSNGNRVEDLSIVCKGNCFDFYNDGITLPNNVYYSYFKNLFVTSTEGIPFYAGTNIGRNNKVGMCFNITFEDIWVLSPNDVCFYGLDGNTTTFRNIKVKQCAGVFENCAGLFENCVAANSTSYGSFYKTNKSGRFRSIFINCHSEDLHGKIFDCNVTNCYTEVVIIGGVYYLYKQDGEELINYFPFDFYYLFKFVYFGAVLQNNQDNQYASGYTTLRIHSWNDSNNSVFFTDLKFNGTTNGNLTFTLYPYGQAPLRVQYYKTSNRPALATTDKGSVIFDFTINKPIWWTGTKWVDATGATV